MTKVVLVFTCCIAMASAVFADRDQHKKKNKDQGQGQGQVQGQGQGKGQGKGQGQKFKGRGQGQKFKGQGQGQGQKFKGQGQGLKFKGQGQGKKGANAQHVGKQKVYKSQNFKTGLPAAQKNKQKFQANKKVYKAKHFNLANKVNHNIPRVKFAKNFHIQGSQNWQGQKYVVFRNYRPMWHDQLWWTGHHNRIVFTFGGWYYWNSGYWYPAWGYDPGAVYYYDGPIYASNPSMDPGQVVANVQSALQEQGYYQGDVDGILGPQTRAALADYQQNNGLEPTAAVDEPTLDSLGMG